MKSAQCVVEVGDNILTLPADLTTIETAAFSNLGSTDAVRNPGSLQVIVDDAFAGSDVVIIAPAGSCAIQWAEENEFEYIAE